MGEEEKIAPCRVCRSAADPKIREGLARTDLGDKPVRSTLQVVCDGCGASGPRCRDNARAVKFWNEMQVAA